MTSQLTSYERGQLATGKYKSSAPTLADDDQNMLLLDASGNLKVALSSGSMVVGTIDIDQTTPGTTNGVVINPRSVTPTDKGGTIAAGGTQQTLAALNANRKALVIQNPATATENLYVAISGSATVNGAGNYAELVPGGSCVVDIDNMVYTGAVSVNAATTGHRFISTELV